MATNFAGSLKTESFAKGLLLVVVTAILTVINCFLSNREWDSVKAYFVPPTVFVKNTLDSASCVPDSAGTCQQK